MPTFAPLTVPPPMTDFGLDMYAMLEPICARDADFGYPVAILCGAYGEMFREVEETVRAAPGRLPWQEAFDIDQAPDVLLPWLGQLVGVRDLNGLTADQQRAKIKAEAGFYRGSVQALAIAIASTLTGRQTVRIVERSSDARTIEAITNTSETPDPTVTNMVGQAAKRAMLLLTIIQSDVPVIDEGARTIDAGTGTIDTAVLSDIN